MEGSHDKVAKDDASSSRDVAIPAGKGVERGTIEEPVEEQLQQRIVGEEQLNVRLN